ncbi:MAG: TRAP-type ATP-independent transport system small permease component [Roseibaca calidilacus]|uniref:TRAP transporter small permease protein n=1 Tax=Roseibaca calidilacus TaxID=1666912 RepID=A0A0P7WVP8_9RHOB|nr:TRAP transporter small permease subunit [Roseibaca calidilacus]KPP91759.1 MAG: TRAP-type ATP-independent transport system small permease component [Roseibaca calidilacus]CUX82563.1 TRAP-type mannitol/chloroaromatic compound transport system, small permease component [Roseibaca calidilacus]
MALRELTGTALAVLALAAAFWLSVLPASSTEILPTLAVLIGALIGAAVLQANPGTFAAATVLGWFGIMFAQPFSLSTREFNGLRRIANRGDEEAAALMAYYEAFLPYATYLMVGLTGLLIAILMFGMARGRLLLFQNLLAASDGLAKFLTRVGVASAVVLFTVLIFAIMYDVTQRQYLGFNSDWTKTEWYKLFSSTRVQEMEWHLHAALFLMVLGYGYIQDAHVRIELVRDAMKPRSRVWVELVGAVLFMVPYCYVVMNYGIENTLRSWTIGESSAATTGLPNRFIIKAMLPFGFALIALAGMSVALKCVVYLFGPPSLRARSNYYAHSHQNPAPVEHDSSADAKHA